MLAMETLFTVLLGIAMFLTLGVLVVGVISFGVHGEFYRRNSNRLMRYRVIFQALALVFFALLMYTVLA
ncbi:MAG: twin transmembrane helix small protein [Magnetovibrio sp.]|nr:twin transmembrane helix small protein [Magnetovibrio sp.]